MIERSTDTYEAFGAIDLQGRAYVGFRHKVTGDPAGMMRLDGPRATISHADERAAAINNSGGITIHAEKLILPPYPRQLFA